MELFDKMLQVANMSDAEKGFQVEARDFYISPTTGDPRLLKVQQAPAGIVQGRSIFRRISNVSPLFARIGTWPKSKVGLRWSILVIPWLLCIFVSFIILAFHIAKEYFLPGNDANDSRSQDYDDFDYQYNGYANTATNAHEDLAQAGKAPLNNSLVSSRQTRPRSPFPRQLQKIGKNGDTLSMVATKDLPRDLDSANPTGFPQYLFVSYTTAQFNVKAETDALRSYALKAAKELGLEYFWDTSCLIAYGEGDDDTYDICDYVRNASSVLVMVETTDQEEALSANSKQRQTQIDHLLEIWGRRAWTFPEALLAKDLRLWIRDEDTFVRLRKKDLLKSAWQDSELAGRLIDHHEGTTILSPLEHVTTALAAIQTRTVGRQYRPGDQTYVLMGFMSQRPEVNPQDSDFEAFARLSLANDSNNLLERLICIAPRDSSTPWHDMNDAWGSKLWHIQPSCQVCGIASEDTVLLAGVQAAGVRWKSFKEMPISLPHIDNCALLGLYAVLSLATILYYPWFVERLLNGDLPGIDDVYDDTARLMGFEGYMPLDEIKKHIWGGTGDRLSWAPFGSPLSVDNASSAELETTTSTKMRRAIRKARGKPNQTIHYAKRCYGQDPWEANGKSILAEAERTGQRIFTLVDTYNEEVIMFLAKRPPVAFIVCGQEGGMLRAVGVSYVHETETLYRECVIRLQAPALDHMHRLGRVRFGFHRPDRVSECLNDSP